MVLNLFYKEPDPDRWVPYDRYPRKIIRRLFRGKQRPGGVMMVALELMRGLDKIGIPYRFNNFGYAKKNPEELIGIIGKPHLLKERKWENPILYGAGIFSHPLEEPDFLKDNPNIKKVLVPGAWMQKMFEPVYGDRVITWPVGIDTEKWSEKLKLDWLSVDFLIYDKIRWEHAKYTSELLDPLTNVLRSKSMTFDIIKYGNYTHAELMGKLARCKSVIFLCEHETQGLAYQQILSTNTPILAWDREDFWRDPNYYPHKVMYQPVSSVPYWNEKCGVKFVDSHDFTAKLKEFLLKLNGNFFSPRQFILENLTLEMCALKYYNIYKDLVGKKE